MSNAYERITNQIIELMESEGLVPWRKTWKGSTQDMARSMATGKLYNGSNAWWLTMVQQMNGYESAYWGTYKQIKAQGGQVRKGQKSSIAVYWNFIEKVDAATGEEKKIPLLKTFLVFNASQADWQDGMPEKFGMEPEAELTWDGMTSNEIASELLEGYTGREGIEVIDGGGRAFYRPASDQIGLPRRDAFEGEGEYFSTAFHEVAHSTGAEHRLNRPGVTDYDGFGSHQYSEEELVAEFASAFLCAEAGIEDTRENSASYIKSWAKVLKGDPKLIIRASGKAAKAAEYAKNGKVEEVSKKDEVVLSFRR